jgi:peptide chain release factor 2
LTQKKQKILELEDQSRAVDFWSDNQKASSVMKELEDLTLEMETFEILEKDLSDIVEFSGMTETAEDENELEKKISETGKKFDELEFKTLLNGEYDTNCAILNIYSGAGGVDAQDWAEMLLRMYLRWGEKNNFKIKLVDETRGQEAGIKSATLEVGGRFAYGYLKSEIGTHRLVRLSPFNSDNLRQTSFAVVEVLPIIAEIKEVKINQEDLRVDVYRSSGAGGQSVNTTDSAVRITHLPTEIMASCQNERSQLQNKEQALKILKAKLHKKYIDECEAEKRKLRGEKSSAEWGSQIRSYVIHPYKLVKDHRTKLETVQVDEVLMGNLKDFMESYLKYLKSSI